MSESMQAESPEHAVELLDEAFNRGDIEAALSFYEDSAVVVSGPGRMARGSAELRSFFMEAIKSGVSAKQIKTRVIEADGIALFLSRWTLRSSGSAGESAREFVAATVFRRQQDGAWKALIDCPIGSLALEA